MVKSGNVKKSEVNTPKSYFGKSYIFKVDIHKDKIRNAQTDRLGPRINVVLTGVEEKKALLAKHASLMPVSLNRDL